MAMRLVILALSTIRFVACREGPVERRGPAQQKITERSFPIPLTTMREAILQTFSVPHPAAGAPFASMKVTELKPPMYTPDWLVTTVDPGGFLAGYKRMDDARKRNDLLLNDPVGDLYWNSEYAGRKGPLKFQSGFIIHLEEAGSSSTRVQIYEKVPQVWAGMYWTFGHSGPGEYRDIRFVDPTVTDRIALLDLLAAIGTN